MKRCDVCGGVLHRIHSRTVGKVDTLVCGENCAAIVIDDENEAQVYADDAARDAEADFNRERGV